VVGARRTVTIAISNMAVPVVEARASFLYSRLASPTRAQDYSLSPLWFPEWALTLSLEDNPTQWLK